MPAQTQSRRRAQDDEDEFVDSQGRRHDSHGRFVSDDEDDEDSGGSSSRGSSSRGGSCSQGRSGGRGGSGGQSGARIISRAVRVLSEIGTRLDELREELEE